MVKFLHQLRIRILNYIATENLIVRLEIDDNTAKNELSLVIFIKDKYYPFLVNQADLDHPDETLEFVMKRLYKEVNLDK